MTEHHDTIIVGAGISGLVIAHKLQTRFPGHDFLLLEKCDRTGGVIESFVDDGHLAEYGPHGFLDNCAESRELLTETGLESECVRASLQTFVRYVCLDSRLMMIPQSPLKIIRAPLIPWADKFRVLGELFKKPLDGEPTVAKWAAHRFGRAVLPYVDAVFTGTYAGDYDRLKIDAVMPGVRALEKAHGSLLRGAVAKAREARKRRPRDKKLTMPAMTSFPGGMQRLPQRLTELLGTGRVRLNCAVGAIEPHPSGWLVRTEAGDLCATNLVLALPINLSLKMLDGWQPGRWRTRVPEAWIATVVFSFEKAELPPGFGYLIPEREGRFSLGTLFSSNMFPNRAPEGHVTFETLVGGRRHPERLELDDETIIERSLADARDLMDLSGEPTYAKVLRPAGGIPQLEDGFTALLKRRNELVEANPGLFVCGFGWDGIGLNDMIKAADSIAGQAAANMSQGQREAELKKVYF